MKDNGSCLLNKNCKYKFSIIMSIYNVEQYLEESIKSILDQSIGFEENVKLILVNDGSTDNSEKVCIKYRDLYQNNIVYVKKENGGVASSKNLGLKYADGMYVNFMDPDDKLSVNALEEVYNFFNRNELCVDLVTLPLYMFEAQTGLHGKYEFMGKKNRIINLINEPYNFVLSSAATFYKYEIIKNMKFDERMTISEDIKFNIKLFEINSSFGYVCEKDVKYNYRKRIKNNSLTDNVFNVDNLKGIIKVFECFDENNLLSYQKEIIIYELRSRLKLIKEEMFSSYEDYKNLLDKYSYYISLIEEDFILYRSKWAENILVKLILMRFKNRDYRSIINDKKLNVNLDIYIKNYYIKEKKLFVEIIYYNYGKNDLEIVAFDGDNKIYNAIDLKDIDGPFDVSYGSFKIDNTHYRKFAFDLNNKIIKFVFKVGKSYVPIRKVRIDKFTKLALSSRLIGLRYSNKIVTLTGRKFKISNNSRSNLVYNFTSFLGICVKAKYIAFLRLFNKKTKKYVLINDRPEKGDDNGEALFKYINYNRKDIAKYTYFVIDKKSKDYKRLKKIGKVVNLRGLKHKFLFLGSKYIYSSHNHKLFYNAFPLSELKYYSDLFDYKFIWLQHGIIQNENSESANTLTSKDDKIIVSTNGEYTELTQEKYFFNNEDVLLTGLARYDYLINEPKNIITFSPTYRKYLTGRINLDGSHEIMDEEIFKSSDYFKACIEILTNIELKELLVKYNFKFKFILHPGMNGYIDLFKQFSSDNVQIFEQSEINYNRIFSETSLLITDYSSINFDFAYLKKPLIYYQFDKEKFFSTQYKPGYFLYSRDGFGDVLINSSEVINKIKFYFENGFKMEEKYISRVNNTFKYNDKNNCQRIIELTYND